MSEFKPLEPRNLGHFTDVEVKTVNNDKHTLGPWEVLGKQGTAVWCGNEILAYMSAARIAPKVSHANARLMAAAPDLLDALRSIVEMNPALPMGMIEAAQSAITKATGETP